LRLGEGGERGQRVGRIPFMIEQANMPENRLPFVRRDADEFMQMRVVERGVRAERDHEVELFRVAQHLNEGAKQEGQRNRTGVIGDEDEDFVAGKFAAQAFFQCFSNYVFRKQSDRGNRLNIYHDKP
jgi:hypothetical protein